MSSSVNRSWVPRMSILLELSSVYYQSLKCVKEEVLVNSAFRLFLNVYLVMALWQNLSALV